jgi:hypothetical protein
MKNLIFNFHFKTETFLIARFHSFARTHIHCTYTCVHNHQLLVYYIYVLTYVKERQIIIFSQIPGNNHKSREKITKKNKQKTGVKFLVKITNQGKFQLYLFLTSIPYVVSHVCVHTHVHYQ